MTYQTTTRVLMVDAENPASDAIATAAHTLRRGGLVAFPTETVYGLGANALDAEAVARIFAAKGRPASDPLIVHLASTHQLDAIAIDVPPVAHELAARFWPGPLTLVLRRQPRVPPNVAAGGETVGVRVPHHPVALALLEMSGLPVAAPSANRFARPSPTSALHVLDDLDGSVDIILDAGATSVGVESTVLDVTQSPPRVLRPGGIALETLRDAIGEVVYQARYLQETESASAPGMLLKHYSPDAHLTVYVGSPERAVNAMRQQASTLIAQGKRVGLMTTDEERTLFDGLPAEIVSLGSSSDLEQLAHNLFAALRDLDSRGIDAILVRAPEQHGIGLTIYDRLVRAAEGRIELVD